MLTSCLLQWFNSTLKMGRCSIKMPIKPPCQNSTALKPLYLRPQCGVVWRLQCGAISVVQCAPVFLLSIILQKMADKIRHFLKITNKLFC
ncbi:hypothetical protein AB3F25_05635 [Aggregatibacter sp. HMT-949]|uniref:hypothetical protein n=1 Tax=Aggregatibacter sp. HMT-949 TaxID=3235088 RepID=UPI00359C4B9A